MAKLEDVHVRRTRNARRVEHSGKILNVACGQTDPRMGACRLHCPALLASVVHQDLFVIPFCTSTGVEDATTVFAGRRLGTKWQPDKPAVNRLPQQREAHEEGINR